MEKITIKNVSNAQVWITSPEAHINNGLVPGRTLAISEEAYEALTYDPGFNSLVHAHYIEVKGIEEDKAVDVIEKVYDRDTIAHMLDTLDITAFAKFIPTAAPAEKETVVDLAVEKKITNSAIVSLIKKYCDRDVMDLINMKHLEEE